MGRNVISTVPDRWHTCDVLEKVAADIAGHDITVGIPCLDEAATIGGVVADFRARFPAARILVIDNGSTDGTGEKARVAGAEVLLEVRRGKGWAVQRLFQECRSAWLLMVDGDDTYPADGAARLVAAADGVDVVVGDRRSDDPRAFKGAHTMANRFLAWLVRRLFGCECGDLFSGMRLFHRRYYQNVPLLSTGFEVETELTLQAIDKCFRQRGVTVPYRPRPAGSVSKLRTLHDGLRVIRILLMIVKDLRPLLFFTAVAGVLAGFSLLAGIWPIADYVQYRYVYRVPLAVLATGLALLSSLSLACGLVLDTLVRQRREDFVIRMRRER